MEEDKLEIYIENYNILRKGKDHINSIDKNFFFDFVDMLIKAYKELKEIEESHRKENGELRDENKTLNRQAQQYFETIIIQSQQYDKETTKKDKIIDEMANKLVEAHGWFYSEFDNYTKEDFKQYFENKVNSSEQN